MTVNIAMIRNNDILTTHDGRSTVNYQGKELPPEENHPKQHMLTPSCVVLESSDYFQGFDQLVALTRMELENRVNYPTLTVYEIAKKLSSLVFGLLINQPPKTGGNFELIFAGYNPDKSPQLCYVQSSVRDFIEVKTDYACTQTDIVNNELATHYEQLRNNDDALEDLAIRAIHRVASDSRYSHAVNTNIKLYSIKPDEITEISRQT